MARRNSLRGPSQGAGRADALITLLDERDFGLLTSVLSLLNGLVVADSARRALAPSSRLSCLISISMPRFRGCLPKVVRLLERLVKNQDVPPDYLYYSIPSPWMQARAPPLAHSVRSDPRAQIKCMRILQQFPVADDPTIARVLSPILQHVISVRGLRAPHALLPSEPAATLRRARTRPRARTRTTRCRR